ncbi:MAG: methyltransferase domain-containing protein [Candidatus Eremiobacteraeota bacterium]|nr:methyltransferase domain-containing protein [Candidatus Eremiobacteraeota bacterium]
MKPTQRFSDRALDYVVGRPSYPDEAIDALFEDLGQPSDLTVVDLGAGTGISSRLLVERGARVIAVEPNTAMSDQSETVPNLVWQLATAEDTRLPHASADLVTAFQAFHWFDPIASIAEIARILRPGGRSALVYNERNENDVFTAAYGALVRCYATDETERRRSDGRTMFSASPIWYRLTVREFANRQKLDRAGLHARARSTSYLPKDGPTATALYAALDALFDSYAAADAVTMQMKTIATIAYLSPDEQARTLATADLEMRAVTD